TLRREKLAFFRYQAVPGVNVTPSQDVESLIGAGALLATPMIYEDFLPISAAGIFQSNLGDAQRDEYQSRSHQAQFEQALGGQVTDEISLYAEREEASLRQALSQLGIDQQ
ncbi:MAG: DUF1338 domain-containing protein, partial [Halomonas sp.]